MFRRKQSPSIMGFHVLNMTIILIFALKSSLSIASPSPTFPIAKPDCIDHCGSISIPFPFGTTEPCYQSYSFFVKCDLSFNPPKLFMQNSSIEITDISLDGQTRMLPFTVRQCYSQTGAVISSWSNNGAWISLPQNFTVNSTANKFTIVGCDAYGFVFGQRLGGNYKTGCTAMCYSKNDLTQGSCSGVGCCQSPIPSQVWKVELDLKSYNNTILVNDFNNCSYAFLVEETAFSFSPKNLTNLWNVKNLPMVADWAIGNATCEEAQMDSASYACKSLNSECYKPNNGYGYRCNCKEGYQGNPYLNGSCQDINECKDPNLNICLENRCENTEGGFNCTCPKGYDGDGKKDGKGCFRRGESPVYKLVAGIAVGAIVLMLAACFLYWELKRRRKQKYFRENGGFLLQEKISNKDRYPKPPLEIFKFSVLQKAMKFHDSMMIADGAYGTVCKVILDDKIVSIKKSKKSDQTQIEQFIDEVIALSQINHGNLVKLLGCCLDTEVPLLVYEFISDDTLYKHLRNQKKDFSLNWDDRLRIAAETAGAILFLHSGCSMPKLHTTAGLLAYSPAVDSTPIVHKNVKSANIFLDNTRTAKVADFGASILDTKEQGTFEYSDPEYMQTCELTEKSDVYSFGVVLAELLTGRVAVSNDRQEEEKNLVSFFLSTLKEDRLLEIVDKDIMLDENKEQLIQVAMLAKRCLNMKGEDRPSMNEVLDELHSLRFGV